MIPSLGIWHFGQRSVSDTSSLPSLAPSEASFKTASSTLENIQLIQSETPALTGDQFHNTDSRAPSEKPEKIAQNNSKFEIICILSKFEGELSSDSELNLVMAKDNINFIHSELIALENLIDNKTPLTPFNKHFLQLVASKFPNTWGQSGIVHNYHGFAKNAQDTLYMDDLYHKQGF